MNQKRNHLYEQKIPLWTVKSLLHALGMQDTISFHLVRPITGVSIDTRTLRPGNLFAAFHGVHCDGHALLDQAFSQHASGALVTQPMHDHRTLYVPDMRKALRDIGHAARKRYTGSVLALTGSTGKTTIKEGLKHVLCRQTNCFASANSFNNDLGLSLSLSNLPADVSCGVFELGMNQPGEIQSLVYRVQPHVAMITNVSYQHGVNFNHLDDIAQEKADIFRSPAIHTAILCHDCSYFPMIMDQITKQKIKKCITFGFHNKATVRIVSYDQNHDDAGIARVHARVKDKDLYYTIPFLGAHWVINSAGILAGVLALGKCVIQASQDLASFMPLAGRGQQYSIGGIHIIDDSYNAAPAAMVKALDYFAHRHFPGRKHVLLGEMRELGVHTNSAHQGLVPLIDKACDHAWLCGNGFHSITAQMTSTYDHEQKIQLLIPRLLKALHPGDALLVKGARSTETFAAIYALYKMYGHDDQVLSYPLLPYLSPSVRTWIDAYVKKTLD